MHFNYYHLCLQPLEDIFGCILVNIDNVEDFFVTSDSSVAETWRQPQETRRIRNSTQQWHILALWRQWSCWWRFKMLWPDLARPDIPSKYIVKWACSSSLPKPPPFCPSSDLFLARIVWLGNDNNDDDDHHITFWLQLSLCNVQWIGWFVDESGELVQKSKSTLWWMFISGSAIWTTWNKAQVSRSFGAKPPCQDLMKNANCKHNINI